MTSSRLAVGIEADGEGLEPPLVLGPGLGERVGQRALRRDRVYAEPAARATAGASTRRQPQRL